MRLRIGLAVLGLLCGGGPVACGGDSEPPANNQVIVPRIDRADAPTELVVTPGNGQVTLTWKAPANNGGSPVTGYTLWVFEEGKAPRSQALKSIESAYTLKELTNGTAYAFAVAATNSLGDGPRSSPSEPVKPRVTPAVPQNVSATPGDRQATVSWQPPVDTGMPIVEYTVTVLDGSTVVATQTTAETRVTVTGLTNGKDYLVTVSARNSVIGGPASEQVEVTPRTVPGAPKTTARTGATEGEILVAWTVDDNGGSRLTAFFLELYEGDQLLHEYRISVTPLNETHVVGLTPGLTYSFRMAAMNEAGRGPFSELVSEVAP